MRTTQIAITRKNHIRILQGALSPGFPSVPHTSPDYAVVKHLVDQGYIDSLLTMHKGYARISTTERGKEHLAMLQAEHRAFWRKGSFWLPLAKATAATVTIIGTAISIYAFAISL